MVKHMMLIVQKGPFAICRQPRPRSAAHLHRVTKAFVDRLQNQWILLYILTTKECSDQTAGVCTLIWIFTVCICHKSPFPMLCIIYSQNYYRFGSALFIIMPPTSKKLEGHIASGLFVRPSVRPFVMLFDA